MRVAVGAGVIAVFAAGCSADVTEIDAAWVDEPGAVDEGASLDLGDSGPDVVAAHAYFSRFGYFESEDLRAEFPRWRPVVGRGPADDAVYGEELRAAVSTLQARAGLEVTGAIDAPTRALMDTPRCGVPDSALLSAEEKWAPHETFPWQTALTLTYRFALDSSDNFGSLNAEQAKAAIRRAFNTWEAVTSMDFTETTSTTDDITVSFIDHANAGTLAIGTPTALFMDNRNGWGTDNDMESVALHEIGHSLGFGHSSVETPERPLMWPILELGETKRTFFTDDKQAIAASPLMQWRNPGGEGVDIGVSTALDDNSEVAWTLGLSTNSEGRKLYRWRESTSDWQQVTGGGVRIDVAGRTPWVVTNAGLAKQLGGVTASTPNGTSWIERGNEGFVDIGANRNGIVWALGGTVDSAGDYEVFRFVGGVTWTKVTGRAVRIDVGQDNVPWVVTAGGKVYRRSGVTGTTPNGTGWSLYGSGTRDVTVGSDGAVWVTGPGGNGSAFLLNIQAALDCDAQGFCDAYARNEWYPTANGGSASFISAGNDGLPWIVKSNNAINRRRQ